MTPSQAFAERLNELDMSAFELDEQQFLLFMYRGDVLVRHGERVFTVSGRSLVELTDCTPATVELTEME